MTKPTYYLWKSDFQNEEVLRQEKKKYADWGFRVTVFQDGQGNIQDGLKGFIKQHCQGDFYI